MLGLALASFSIISETLELHSSIACGLKCFDKDPFGIGNKNLSFLKIDAAIMHKFTPEFITSLAGVLLYLASHLLLPVTQTNCFWWQDINHRKKCLKFSPKPQKILV
jgi:hypothetical protein